MSQKNENWFALVLATIGIAGVAFSAGMHRLVWTLFWVVAVVWMLFCWWGGSKSRGDENLWWLLAIGPTVVVGIVIAIVEGIVFALFGGLKSVGGSFTPPSQHSDVDSK